MVRFRSLLLLVALATFVLPSFGISKVTAHVMTPAQHAAPPQHTAPAEQTSSSMDCHDQAPPPDCPAEGSAKHAAGTCCPLMAGVVALPSSAATADTMPLPQVRVLSVGPSLTGLISTQDPPPPRA